MDVSICRRSLPEDGSAVEEILAEYHAATNRRGQEWFDDEEFGLPPEEMAGADIDRLRSAAIERPLFLALDDGVIAGTIQVKRLDERTAEVKRLYVREEYRGIGIGRRLVETVVTETRADGFEILRLGVAPYHERAQALYQDVGFEFTPPYEESNCPEWLHDDWNFMAYAHEQ